MSVIRNVTIPVGRAMGPKAMPRPPLEPRSIRYESPCALMGSGVRCLPSRIGVRVRSICVTRNVARLAVVPTGAPTRATQRTRDWADPWSG
jgi:hypothetical protein